MEAVVDLLEKPRLQPHEDVLHLSCGPYGWNNFLAGSQKKVITELPFVLVQTVFFSLIVYSMAGFKWAVHKFFWFFFITYISFLYFTYYGMMTVSITPNHQVASILAAAFYALFVFSRVSSSPDRKFRSGGYGITTGFAQ
ncbi:ABC transporter G family member 36 [Camellia lanceoleosa]|uniref:ABC transporter G family member 36 n=1 Tax=Camellia lanceoleosa TaxID=1840588 RepID=A0ACC0FDA8_9ERIC|nr:ABC transporter G family member 36 [Camellia lanceoleosa]